MQNLIVFVSKTGFTEKTATILKSKLKGETELINLKKQSPKNIETYDKIILGSGIYVGKLSPVMTKFISSNIDLLRNKKIGIFVTSGDRETDFIYSCFPQEIVEKALAKGNFGGGLDIKRLSFVESIIMRVIGKYRDYCDIENGTINDFATAMEQEKKI